MILLDDVESGATNPSSRLYQEPIAHWAAFTAAEMDDCFEAIQSALKAGQYVVCLVAYEYGQVIHRLPIHPASSSPSAPVTPLMQAWAFHPPKLLAKAEVDAWLEIQLAQLKDDARVSGVASCTESITQSQFEADVERIQEWIRCGDTYQINHTYRINGEIYGDPLALYARLRARQPGRFGAFIQEGDTTILSQSPELFVERNGDCLRAMPMKGTASAQTESPEQLASDPKNRAENIMIVDLLRNDLSRVALAGSVSVPNLFHVAQHGNVLQMTSTIEATAKPDLNLRTLLDAVFPCGSVTGAPKKRSMEIIQKLEGAARGYYCGALGWLDPNGDFAFSVPIRTLTLQGNSGTPQTKFTLGIGAGITIDSDPKLEWQECQIKSAFITEMPTELGLFETIRVEEKKPLRLAAHLRRLQHSAFALRIPFVAARVIEAAEQACLAVPSLLPHRLRIDLLSDSSVRAVTHALEPIANEVTVFWASQVLPNANQAIMQSSNMLLGHKVNQRTLYDLAWKNAVALGGFDAVFLNEAGFVTEGGRSSIFIQPKGSNEWLTSPLSAGVLPGLMRQSLLDDPQWNARQAMLTAADLADADRILVCNALRGAVPAVLKVG
ncbi:bifunctional chorismate-binding protein/class IV aminotransferase [Polynucleobacter sp.]|uniref:bifunctional chorismate-binding protein/class IV aminotransferase n=1 Tax=Polynucleobacter sp. TaxID=2029855 RepID=UPI002732C0DE|nr:bifunctional anthranilate synthase component I family protein/class IV aminotransferase [Polynucleobacter sp.]MDP3122483.1 bifunctional anthranilate synthase component I family protein/class IV aminotransferase [Polynucleobacter sp.]